MKIILGSASARRAEILKELGYDFEVKAPDIDEKAIRDSDPAKLTMALAEAKADAILKDLDKPCLIITADLVVVFKDKIIEKPESKEEAYSVLKSYTNLPIQTVTSVVITNTQTGKKVSGTHIATVCFNPIPDENMKQFVESGKAFEHAGSFAAENPLFAPYVKRIEGGLDSIMGLPKELTQKLIEEAA